MAFHLPQFLPPDFKQEPLRSSPLARFVPAPADGIAPDDFHATSNFPEYVHLEPGRWQLCADSRMDCVVTLDNGVLKVKEFRNLKKGEPVLVGRMENGEEGILVYVEGFTVAETSSDKFQFKTRVTRETPFSRSYDSLYEVLRYEKEHGFISWVLGPAVTFDQDSRDAMIALIEAGYCQAILAGNALATHDLEVGVYGTALGQDIYNKHNYPLGHYNHLEVLNRIRRLGSIDTALQELKITKGIIPACVQKGIPFILAGSIRDDGPLPEVISDVYVSQDKMRTIAKRTTTVITLATQLHSIAFGNMIPSYQVTKEGVRPVYFYIVDISEFAVDKLANRGSFQAVGISTNVQDFCVNLRRALVG